MAILAQIRNRPIFLIFIIGMALFAFVLAGVFDGSSGPSRSNIGSVNGEEITPEAFSKQLERFKNNGTSSVKSVTSAWNSIVREKVFKTQIEEAGIVVSEKDIWESIISNPQNQNAPRFKDEAGLFDENKLKEYVTILKENKDTPQGRIDWQNWITYERDVKANLKETTYNNLIKSGLTASLKEGERTYVADNTSIDVQLIHVPYTSIKKEEITITDSEITTYMNKNLKEFEVEASTKIDFVKFEINPSKEDITAAKNKIQSYKLDFKNATNVKEFVNEYSDTPFIDKLYMKTDLTGSVYDSLINKANGSIYGPYKEGSSFKLIRLMDKNGLKSAKSSHILIAYTGAERAKPTVTRTKEEAEKFAKKIKKEITSKNFADKAKLYSDGPSGETKGGDIGWFDEKSSLAKEYKDFIFSNKKGAIQLVETSFGFHIINITDTKTEDGLNLAIVSLQIEPSELTESKVFQAAETFASDLTNGNKQINDLSLERNYKVKSATNIKIFDEKINGLGNQREIVKWSFEKDRKEGDIKRFDLDNDGYVVVIVKNKSPKGLMSLTNSRPKVTPILTKEKQATLIRVKLKGETLDEIAKSINKPISTSNNISITNPTFKVGSRDLNVAGSLLHINVGDVKIINGTNGVFVIKVIKKTAPFKLEKFNTYSNKITENLQKRNSKIYEALKDVSQIEDNRAVFY